MMYDELAKRLREATGWKNASVHYSLMKQAADAIEELRGAERKYLHNISVLESEAESLKRRFVTFAEQVPQWMPLPEPPKEEA